MRIPTFVVAAGIVVVASAVLPAQNLRRAVTVATVADLYASNPADDDVYTTRGYSQEGVGGNTYRYDAAAVTAVDYGYVLDGRGGNGSGTGTGRFIAVTLNEIRATQYGVLPSGDSTVAFGRAVDAAMARGLPLLVDLPAVSLATWTAKTTTASLTIRSTYSTPATLTGPGGAVDLLTLTAGDTAVIDHVRFASFRYVANQGGADRATMRTSLNLVATVASLYALEYARDDEIFQTRGYSTEGIGANQYRYDVSSTATPDYGFVLDGPGGNGTGTGTGRFFAVGGVRNDITQFGAVSGADSTTAIQAAVTVAHVNGLPVFIPPGTFPITTTITCVAGTQRLEIFGAGRAVSIIDATGLTNTPAISVGNSTWTKIHNFKLLGDSSSGHGIQGLDPVWTEDPYLPQHLSIEKMFIQGFTGQQTMLGNAFGGSTPANDKVLPACGIFLAGGLELNVYDSSLYGNDIGIYTYSTAQPKVVACVFDGNSSGGYISQNDEKPVMDKCDVLTASTAVGTTTSLMANTARRNSATIDAAGVAIIGSHGAVVRDSKFKGSRVNIVLESDYAPVVEGNWIRSDVKTGVLNYGPVRIERNTFYPVYIAPKTFTTLAASHDKLLCTAHGFSNDEEVVLSTTGTGPAGLYVNTPLFVKNKADNDFELAASAGGATLDITTDGSGTHSVAICRRDVWSNFPDSNVCDVGSVSRNVFSYGGGGVTQSWIQVSTPNDSYPIDGVIEGNYFGQPYSTANAAAINFGVMATGATRGLTVRDNVYHVPTNATIQFRVYAPGNSVTPGFKYLNNVTQTVGGSVTQADVFPANGLYQSDKYFGDGVLSLNGHNELFEISAPGAPGANKVRIYAEDNGSGKTRLMAIFPSGAAQQITIEP